VEVAKEGAHQYLVQKMAHMLQVVEVVVVHDNQPLVVPE
jgi:hypothetical protein